MIVPNISIADEIGYKRSLPDVNTEPMQVRASAVSWGAIMAGAAAAASLSLILLMLGTGLGLSSVSPWAYDGISATTFGVSTILWLAFTQIIASGVGGYLAGRLRTKWISVHTDEVYFRDTAHGFLAWAIASLATAALLTSVIGHIVRGGIQTGGVSMNTSVGVELAKLNRDSGPMGYYIDSLYRINMSAVASASAGNILMSEGFAGPDTAEAKSEVTRIFLNSIRSGALPAEDIRYVGQIVSIRTGLTQQSAERRVVNTYALAQAKLRDAEVAEKEAADKVRKTSAYTALWLFISLLIGAFVASFSATFGGRLRDL